MMHMADAAQLSDIHEIQQVLLLYPVALDSRALELLEQVFVPDARIDIPGVGVVDLAGYQAACRAGLGSLDATHHVVNAPLLRVDGDVAHARSYLVAQHVCNAAAPEASLLIGAWYNDELRRTPAGWRITARSGNAVWWSGNPAILGMTGLPQAFPRLVGHGAPAWALPH
jgi:hypothetical protein